MINPTEVIRFLERKLGYKFTQLELSHEEILSGIRSESLITFSKYFPRIEEIRVFNKDLVPGYENRYYLDTETSVLNINRVIGLDMYSSNSAIIGGTPRAGSGSGSLFENQMMSNIQGQINPSTFRFIHPNQIEIAPQYTLNGILVYANAVHSEHFDSIPVNLQEHFMQLCLYDTQESLYQIRHRFQNIQTTYGSIELFIEDLADGKNKKEELVEKMRIGALKHSRRKKIFFAR
ncbi:hypothetical protein FPHOBKDP_00134 [Listeria phage LPJP1]|nr:hypothetical protein FPHOBKDP_00134 [Listeria phage LPJP1]